MKLPEELLVWVVFFSQLHHLYLVVVLFDV